MRRFFTALFAATGLLVGCSDSILATPTEQVPDSLLIEQVLDHTELATLDLFSMEMCSPPKSAACRYSGQPGFPALIGPFAASPTALVTVAAPTSGVTVTGEFCGRAWRTGSDSVSRSGVKACGLGWSYTGGVSSPPSDTTPPTPVDTLPPGAVIFQGAPTVTFIPGDGSLPPPDTTPPVPPDTTPPPPTGSYMPELPRDPMLWTYALPVATGNTITVAPGDDLQAALNAIQCGDEIVVDPSVRFLGHLRLPQTNCGTTWNIIRTAGIIPAFGVRVHPSDTTGMFEVVSPDAHQAYSWEAGVAYWWITGGRFLHDPNRPVISSGRQRAWWTVGEWHNSTGRAAMAAADAAGTFPHHIVLDRVYIHGNPQQDTRTCVRAHADDFVLIDSWLGECHEVGSDSQALAGFWGPRRAMLRNNTFESDTENTMFGGPGGPNVILSLIPQDITLLGNYVVTPHAWNKNHPGFVAVQGTCGSQPCRWSVKKASEAKLGIRVLYEGNVFDGNWPDAQSGGGLLFQNTEGTNGRITDFTFRDNLVMNTPGGISFCTVADYRATDGNPNTDPWGMPPSCERLAVYQNWFMMNADPIFGTPGSRKASELYGSTKGTLYDHNTFWWGAGEGYNFISLHGVNREGTVVTNNVYCQVRYGVSASGAMGQAAWDKIDPTAMVAGNLILDATPLTGMTGFAIKTQNCGAGFPDASGFTGTDGLRPGADPNAWPLSREDAVKRGS